MSEPSPSSPDKSAIARAIEARLKAASDPSDSTQSNQALTEKRQRETRLFLAKIVDTQIRRDNNYQQAAKCLSHLFTLIQNIANHPKESKYRSLKPTNPTLSKELFPVSGAREFIMELGFRIRRKDFTEAWVLAEDAELSPLGLEKVQLAKEVLEEKMKVTETLAERETRMKKEESDFEKGRKARALEEFNQDRERRAQRDAVARRARAAAETSNDTDANRVPSLDLHEESFASSKRVRLESHPAQTTGVGAGAGGEESESGSGSGRRLGGDLPSHTSGAEVQTTDRDDDDENEDEEKDVESKEEMDEDGDENGGKQPQEKHWGGGQRLGGE